MTKSHEELIKLSEEVKQLSAEIATMKRSANRMDDGAEKDLLKEEIKMRQFQALFYIEKMENLNQQSNRKS